MRKLKLLLVLCLVAIAASASKTVYLVPGTNWNYDGARFAVCLLSNPQRWVDFQDPDGDGMFSATIEDNTKMIFVRMNGATTENNWDNKWTQTADIDAPIVDGLIYTITSQDGNYSVSGETYLYNVGANAYLDAGASWGTHAALKSPGFVLEGITANNGKYSIATPRYNGSNHWFNDNGYVDSNEHFWTFEPVEGQNAIKLKTSGGNYAYAASGLYNVDLGADPGTNKAYWRFVTATKRDDVSGATNLTPVELTHKINNPRFDDNNSGWEDAPTRGGNTGGTSGNEASFDDRNPCAEHFNKTYDTYQTLTGLVNGTYAVSVQGFYREGGYNDAASKHVAGSESLNALLYANDETEPLMSIFEGAGKATGGKTATATGINGVFPDDMAAASYFFSAGLYWNTVYVSVTDGTLKFGIKKSTSVGSDWTIFDNFRLQYFGNCSIAEAKNGALIVAYNEALAAAQSLAAKAMEASAKTALNSVIDANDDLNTASATAAELTAATTALNEAISAAQPSAALYENIRTLLDGLKTQDAQFDGETKYAAGEYTSINEVYSAYYTFAINKLGSAANTDYTASIVNPSFEYGNTLGWTFQPSNANESGAKTYGMSNKDGNWLFNIWDAGHAITQTITGLPNGMYELKAVVANNGAKVYLIANDAHEGIQCVDENTGVEGSVKVAVTDGNLTIGAAGCNNDDSRTFSAVGVWWYKVDNFRLTYLGDVVSDEDANAILAEVPEGKMGAAEQSALTAAKTAFETSKSTDNYNALRTAIDNANASIAAYTHANTELGLIVAELETTNVYDASLLTALQTAYTNGTLTTEEANAITMLNNKAWHAANTIDNILMSYWDENVEQWNSYHVNTWSNEGDNDGSNFKVPFYEYWTGDANSLGAKTLTATVPGLTVNGEYSVSAWVRVRQANSNTKVDNSITLQVGDGETVDVTQGTQIGTSQFYIATYTAKGTADANGNLIIKFNVAAESNISWLSFKNVKYKEFIAPTADEKAALAAAIAEVENKTLGFDANEYAPYNNVAALEALAAAKAINVDAVSGEDVVAATTALTAATYTANTTDVDAIYDGDLANAEIKQGTSGDNVVLAGWVTKSGNTRQTFKGNGEGGKACLGENEVGLFVHPGTYNYGETVGYTMPLNAGQDYVVEAKYCSWGNGENKNFTLSILKNGAVVATKSYGANGTACTEANAFKAVKLYFTAEEDANYVLSVNTSGNTFMTGFHITKAPVFAVVGNAPFFSGSWDQATQTDCLTPSNGVLTKTYTEVVLDREQTVEYKVISKTSVEATDAAFWYDNNTGNNLTINTPVKGKYDVTFTFDGSEVSGVVAKVSEAVTIGEKGWATTVTNSALDFSAQTDVEAYTAKVKNNAVELTKVDDVIAETGLVLKGATAGTYYIPVISSSETEKGDLWWSSTESYNIWQPSDDGSVNTFYGLTVNTSYEAQFVKINDAVGTPIPAGKAFLMINTPAGGAARELRVVFAGDETTAVDAMTAEKSIEAVYNLNGQRVNNPAKGLYIVNGKKVVLK